MEVTLSVRLPVDAPSVGFARGLCRQALEHFGVPADVVAGLTLALTEACSNVVRHADAGDDYEVQVEIAGDVCRIAVLDRGAGLAVVPPPTPEGSLLESGRGLVLMQRMVDDLRFESATDGRHRVVLEKRLQPAPAGTRA